MLPFQLLHAVVLSVISSVSHIVVLSLRLTVYTDTHYPYLANQVRCDPASLRLLSVVSTPALLFQPCCCACVQLLSSAVVFLCGSVVGAFHKVLMEKTLRQTFKDTLRCLSMRMKLEIEKRQQVSGSRWPRSHREPARRLHWVNWADLRRSVSCT